MRKIALWGSIASIVSAAIAALTLYSSPSASQAGNQTTTYGNQSPAINEPKGDINIQYNNAAPAAKGHVLRNKTAGASLVVSEPNIDAGMDEKKRVCMAIAGTPITLLGETAKLQGIDMWRKVKIDNGDCAGKVGWAAIENISIE
jgi:hypothetical protein